MMRVYDSQSEKTSMDSEQIDTERCCSSKPIYKINYNFISKTWFVCNECIEIECFNSDIKEKLRVKQ